MIPQIKSIYDSYEMVPEENPRSLKKSEPAPKP
jgi:hypothetical protein